MRPFKTFAALILLLLTGADCASSYDFWSHMLHGEALLDTLPFEVRHYSSWARNGSGSDMGWYQGSAGGGWNVLCDVAGPGVMAEFWCTRQPLSDTCRLRIFVDDTTQAVIDTSLRRLLGSVPPFLEPLADSAMNAWFSFVPVPFQTRLKVHYRGASIYYHVNVLTLGGGDSVEPFTMPPSASYLARLDSLRERFLHPELPTAWTALTAQLVGSSTTVLPHATATLVNYSGSGGSRRLFLYIDRRTKSTLENVWVRVYTDYYPLPDFEGPISTVFGAALGWNPYRSAFSGMLGDTLYLNLPLPFRTRFRVEAENRTDTARTVGAWAEVCQPSAQERGRFKLRGVFHEENPNVKWLGYEPANLSGLGTFFGLLFDIQAVTTRIYEGDETIWRNGEAAASWHGTGTEDYFDAGYYWTPSGGSEWYSAHGCIRFTGVWCAPYRWNLTDPVPFESGFRMNFEVGPFNDCTGHYRSLALFAVPRGRWQVADASGDLESFPAETLHVVGQGLTPGTSLQRMLMGQAALPVVSGGPVASADSVLDVRVLASQESVGGDVPITVELSSGNEIVAAHWIHHASPSLRFRLRRPDVDSLQFKGDTLNIFMQGMTPHGVAAVSARGFAFPWLGAVPQADDTGALSGSVIIPSELFPGDHTLEAASTEQRNSACGQTLRVRPFIRYEVEELPNTTGQVSTNQVRFAGDYMQTSPLLWGRGLARYVLGQGVGSYIECRFRLPAADSLQALYFFGRTGGGAKVHVLMDSATDVDSFDTCYPAVGWRWARSDTVFGAWHYLTAGEHLMRFEIAGRNASSYSWEMILDQAVLRHDPAMPVRVPRTVTHLTACFAPDGVRLRWAHVRQDTSGAVLMPEAYAVYRALGPDSVFRLVAEVPGTDSAYTDIEAPSVNGAAVYYVVTARAGLPTATELREAALGRAFSPMEVASPARKDPP
jgi:hypothetical protein